MKNLPVSSFAFVWTDKGPKIVQTDDCGDMIDLSSLRRARRRPLPDSLLRLTGTKADAGRRATDLP